MWRKTPRVTNVHADTMEQGRVVFLAYEVAKEKHFGVEADSVFVQGLREDADRNLTFRTRRRPTGRVRLIPAGFSGYATPLISILRSRDGSRSTNQ